MKIRASVTLKETQVALETFNKDNAFDISNVDIKELRNAIKAEIECGQDSNDLVAIISDLSDTIGLQEFRITER